MGAFEINLSEDCLNSDMVYTIFNVHNYVMSLPAYTHGG